MLLFAYRKLTVLKGDSLGKQVESRQNFTTISFAETQFEIGKEILYVEISVPFTLPPTKETSVSSFLMLKSFINRISWFNLSFYYLLFCKENNACCEKNYLLTMVRGKIINRRKKNPTTKMRGFLILSIKK